MFRRLGFCLVVILGVTVTSSSGVEVIEMPEKLEMCQYGNSTYQAGEKFRPDSCTVCHCPRHGGRALCTIQDCLWEPHCLRRHKKADECCGSCLEQGCLHSNGRVYSLGATVHETTCEKCVCPTEGGPTTCTQKVICPEIHCVDPVTDADSCCPKCLNGNNCWMGKRTIRAGVVIKVGRCRQCQCPALDSLPHWRKASGPHAICTTRPC